MLRLCAKTSRLRYAIPSIRSCGSAVWRDFVAASSMRMTKFARRDSGSCSNCRTTPPGDLSLFDLVIVDEAHAARNAETANYHFVEAVRDAAASLVMLTATPLQTNSENLFNLLRLIDPDRFVSLDTFEQARRANIPLIESLNALLRTPPDLQAFRRHLEAASREPLLRHDRLLQEIVNVGNLNWGESQRLHTARLLESRSLLADVMVRT